MATDLFKGYADTINCPGRGVFAVTPDNDSDLTYQSRAIFCTGAGNVNIVTPLNPNGVVVPLQANNWYSLSITRVKSTSTTATGIYVII